MRLADLLADRTLEDLTRLAREQAHAEEPMARPQLLATIEGVLRSHRFLQEFIFNRQPPTFAILTLLLDVRDFSLPDVGLQLLAEAETTSICNAIASWDLLKRDDQLRVYRRVLYQARSNDMQIDSAEWAILGVLRQELGVSQVEHFLIEHHADLREFWHAVGSFARELHELTSAGIVFQREGQILIPEDIAPVVRQVLGIEMARDAVRRLFQLLDGHELYEALQSIGAATSGSKDEKVSRLVLHMASPRAILRGVGLDTLRTICRDIGTSVSGAKGDLIDRIVRHLAAGRDLVGEPELPPPPPDEARLFTASRFRLLFGQLRGLELSNILTEFDLRRGGPKSAQVDALWDARRAETTLLSCLSNFELDVVLRRLDLKQGGSKSDRIDRLVQAFAIVDQDEFRSSLSTDTNNPRID